MPSSWSESQTRSAAPVTKEPRRISCPSRSSQGSGGQVGPVSGLAASGIGSGLHSEVSQGGIERGLLVSALGALSDDERAGNRIAAGWKFLLAGSGYHHAASRHPSPVHPFLGASDVDDLRRRGENHVGSEDRFLLDNDAFHDDA